MRSASPLNYRHAVSDKPATAVNCDYIPLSHLANYLADPAKKIMAMVSFGKEGHVIPPQPCLHINVDAPQLGDTRLVEVWTSPSTVSRNEHQGIDYAVTGNMLLGHVSCHSSNPLEQLRETLQNIESLLEHAKRTSNTGCGSLNNLSSMKIYIRHAQHFAEIRLALEQHIGHEIPTLYLQGDICRNDLLLEIEAIYHTGGN